MSPFSEDADAPTLPPLKPGSTDGDGSGVGSSDETVGWTRSGSPGPNGPLTGLPPELAEHPRYRLTALIGSGGMGDVYLAEHRVMMRPVAIKTIRPAFLYNEQSIERFHREIRAAAALTHPNIVAAFDAEQAGNVHFLVMEYVEGVDLGKYLRDNGPLTFAKACHFVRQAALGLQHAHEKGMAHRDIKPHNLILTAKNQIKILDFGLARLATENAAGEGLTAVGSYMGTADYIAPEQASDARLADIRSDIYSLGCTFFQLLTGRVPFEGGSNIDKIVKHCNQEPPAVTEFRPGVPADVVAVLARMLAKDPAQRFQQPSDVAKALEPVLRVLTTKGLSDSSPQTVVTARQRAATEIVRPAARIPEKPAAPRQALASNRPSTRSQKSRSSTPWAKQAVAGIAAACALIAVAWLATANSRRGSIALESDDPAVGVLVLRDGQQVDFLNATAKPRVRLREGDYELRLSELKPELRVEPERVKLGRGEVVVATVRLLPPAPVVSAPPKPSPPERPNPEPLKDVDRSAAASPASGVALGKSTRQIRAGSLLILAEAPRETAAQWIEAAFGNNRVVIQLRAQNVGGSPAFLAVAMEATAQGRARADFDLTPDQVPVKFKERQYERLRARTVAAYTVNGQPRFAVLWGSLPNAENTSFQYDRTIEQLQQSVANASLKESWFCVHGYSRDGRDLFATCGFKNGPPIERVESYGWANQFHAALEDVRRNRPDLIPVDISMWNSRAQRRFAFALRANPNKQAWVVDYELPGDKLGAIVDRRVAEGKQLRCIASSERQRQPLYTMVWVERPAGRNPAGERRNAKVADAAKKAAAAKGARR